MIWTLLEVFFILLTAIMVAYLIRHLKFTFSVLREAKTKDSDEAWVKSDYRPIVSIMIPAHNEQRVIGRLLERLTELTYPKDKIEVIVIDDASTDATGLIADVFAKKYNFIKVLHRSKTEGGKGKTAAMNDGFRHSKGDLIFCLDADYYPQKELLEKIVFPFQDPEVGAVQGRVVVENESDSWVTRIVTLERIGGYRVDQQARHILSLTTQFGGTVACLRRSLLEKVGAWDENMLAEDTDLTMTTFLEGYKIPYVVDAECYEEAVDTLGKYWHQRYRWARGHMECCFKHELNVLRSKKLGLMAKIDGVLLLNIYFMPIVVLVAILVGIPLIFFSKFQVADILWFSVPITLYSFIGNFAPFFEVGIGAYLDGRHRIQWLVPLMIVTFPLNMAICTKAFADLLGARMVGRKRAAWVKTSHMGNVRYLAYQNIIVVEKP